MRALARGFSGLLLLVLAILLSSFHAHAQFFGPSSPSPKTGKEACSYIETPALDDQQYNAVKTDQQFNILRELRSRLTDLLPKQRARDEASRIKSDKLRAEKENLDQQSLPGKASGLTSAITSIDQAIAANRDRSKAPNLSEDDKATIQREYEGLQGQRGFLVQNLEDTKNIQERATKSLPQELKEAETASQQENSCYQYLLDLNSKLEQRTIELLLPASQQNTFKLTLSAIYAGIVFALIIGFYLLAFKDEKMRNTIFSQQSGIQFITLFSLVIAIILFGILGILQDKELAALLGGLSGYILGRVTTDRATAGAALSPRAVSATTIGFAPPNQITDTGNGFAIFSAGDRIRISGSANNNGVYTIAAVGPGAIQTRETTIQNEPAGANVEISSV
jgi:hypothetical protein